MTTVLKAAVILPSVSGQPRDQVVNTFHFTAPDVALPAAGVIATALQNFYNSTHGGAGTPVAHYLNGTRVRSVGGSTINIYVQPTGGGATGSPLLGVPFTLGAEAGQRGLPLEVATCLSWHGDFTGAVEFGGVDANIPSDEDAIDQGAPAVHSGNDRPRSRRRGRTFIGPLNIDAIVNANGAVTEIRPSAAWLGDLALAAGELHTAAVAAAGAAWVVYSKRDTTTYPVTGSYVDNEFDTQRRRGLRATARTPGA